MNSSRLPDPRFSSKPRVFHPGGVEDFRQHFESDKHWSARRQFILKHLEEYEEHGLNKLLALSMVWVNHVFLGCRYGSQLLEKVLAMAEGIDAGEGISYQLVLSDKAKKRPLSSDGVKEPMGKMAKFKSRPRFEPIRFVTGGDSKQGKSNEKEDDGEEVDNRLVDNQGNEPSSLSSLETARCDFDYWPRGTEQPTDGTNLVGSTSSLMGKLQQYTNKYNAHHFRQSDSFQQAGRVDRHETEVLSGRWDSGLDSQVMPCPKREFSDPCGGGSSFKPIPTSQSPVPNKVVKEKQWLITRVSANLLESLRDPGSGSVNSNFLINHSIQACKTNPQYNYVNFKDLGPADLPKNKKIPNVGYACELRCQDVYLATGYSGSKNGARDRASEQAVKLFMKPVEVRVLQRLYKHKYVNDLVVCQVNAPDPDLPPPLCDPENKPQSKSKVFNQPDRNKHWSQFVLMENAHDNICILNNSAAHSRMKISYTFDQVPNSALWVCGVYLQGELVAQATGNKKASKHLAADEAVKRLRLFLASRQNEQHHVSARNHSSVVPGSFNGHQESKQLGELVILENSDNSICTINNTAQFNKVDASYKFMVLPDHNWRCDVYLDDKYVASGIGAKKTVKNIAAMEAVAALKRRHAVVTSTLQKNVDVDSSISREQIMQHSREKSLEQVIKEDNIGNQLLRKMGWTGGGLGREEEGITQPVEVVKNFNRGGVGLNTDKQGQITWGDFEKIICNFAKSDRQDNLCFSSELNKDERMQIHQISRKYGLCSKSYGRSKRRFLVVSRKIHKNHLIDQLLQGGQVGQYKLVKPQGF
ncbi:hypothetical protein DNTS_000275 [Danionella cerebrum]|uniref:NF-kappa-B-repressing factor n=1 Tax=Danionella cerebrum TaxID=2873325 RepID=A0A553R701_9TELE|nr:hypothetical protein DNTS_000275 [Danionella translucida]